MEKAEQHLPPTFLGLTRAEAKRWSVIRAVKAIATDPFKMPGAEYERELSDAVARNLGRPPNPGYLYVPLEVQQRVMLAGTAASGGNLIGTQSYIPGASFASALRAQDPLAAFNIERFGPMTGDFGMRNGSPKPAPQPSRRRRSRSSTRSRARAPRTFK